jgi:DNA mismatch endonuclease (patch repair protein)
VSTPWSAQLRGRRVRDTEPEKTLRRAVHALGLRFRLHRKVAPRTLHGRLRTAPVLRRGLRRRLFLARLPLPRHAALPRANASRWEGKITANMERDSRNTEAAGEAGWTVVRIWE